MPFHHVGATDGDTNPVSGGKGASPTKLDEVLFDLFVCSRLCMAWHLAIQLVRAQTLANITAYAGNGEKDEETFFQVINKYSRAVLRCV